MMDILTKPKVIELSKLYDAMIQFRFARCRLKKYGHAEPEPSQLFETLKVAASALTEKEPELQFRFQHYLMKHSSVNGLVSNATVQEMYDMIVENARNCLDVSPSADVKALQSRIKDRKRMYEQTVSRNQGDLSCFNCGSKDHWFKDCPQKPVVQRQVPQQNQGSSSQQSSPSKTQGKVQPRTLSQQKGKGKGKGKKVKDDARTRTQKGKGKGRVRPGANAVEWEDSNPENLDEEYGFDVFGEDQDLEEEPQEYLEGEESYDCNWEGNEQDEQEQPEFEESMAKKILAKMMKFVEKDKGKEYIRLSLSSLRINNEPVSSKRVNILLDGGASHNVYFGPKIPKGALRREVELASGTKVGYVKGSDITFIDEAISEEQAHTPSIVSLGRLIQQGVKMEWTKDVASIELPN